MLFVGDDDFCSLLVREVARPRRVVVVDVDERVLDRLSAGAAAGAAGPPVEVIRHDVTTYPAQPLPDALRQQFDVFVTDPPWTLAGMMYFCAFGIASLRPGEGAAAFVAVPWLARYKFTHELLLRVQQAFLLQGFLLSDVRRGFHLYDDGKGCVSSMLRAESFTTDREPSELVRGLEVAAVHAPNTRTPWSAGRSRAELWREPWCDPWRERDPAPS